MGALRRAIVVVLHTQPGRALARPSEKPGRTLTRAIDPPALELDSPPGGTGVTTDF
jgi:hypothetical protein